MHSNHKVGLAATVALVANAHAFIIPSTMSLPQTRDAEQEVRHQAAEWKVDALMKSHINIPQLQNNAHDLRLDCSECTFVGSDGETKDVASQLQFFWSVSEDGSILLLNGSPFIMDEWPYNTRQIASDGDETDNFVWVDSSRITVPAGDGTDAELTDLDVHPVRVGNKDVEGLDRISVRVLKNEDGRLTISDAIQVPANGDAPFDDSVESEDTTFTILPIDAHKLHESAQMTTCPAGMPEIMCALKAHIEGKVAAMNAAVNQAMGRIPSNGIVNKRPCPGRQGMHRPSTKGGVDKFWAFRTDGANGEVDATQPNLHEHKHGHAMHHGGCRMRKIMRVLHRFMFGFLVPVLIGVAAGMTASLLGLVVGTTLAMLWFRVVRGGKKGGANQPRSVEEEDARKAVAEEKMGLLQALEETQPEEDQEPLPVYVEREEPTQ